MSGEIVLVADDRADNLAFIREYVLKPHGYEMIAASNGEDALRTAQSQNVDLIISDLVMPKMGGLELLEHLRTAGNQLPAILMTFHGSEDTAVRAFRLGARDYIIKPFSIEEMLAAIDRALSEARLRKERDRLTRNLLNANQQLSHRVQELRILFGIGRSITALLDLEQVLNRIVEAAVYLSKAKESSLILVDEAGNLVQRSARKTGKPEAAVVPAIVSDSVAEAVIRRGEPLLIDGRSVAPSGQTPTDDTSGMALAVPLKVGDQVTGVLIVRSAVGHQAFNQQHLNLLTVLADYTSIAIENARMYAAMAEEADEAERYGRVLEKEVAAQTAALTETRRKLEQSERLNALGRLAVGLVQEINTPLESVLHQTQSLTAHAEDSDRSRQLIETIEQETLRCQNVLRGLQIYVGEDLRAKLASDVNLLLERAWEQVCQQKDFSEIVEVIMGLDPHLPLVPAEPPQLERAFYYVLRSAAEAMPMGGELRLTTRVVGPEVQIIVADTGAGIPADEVQHLFDPFYKTSRHTYSLGLSIAHGVFERHSGRVEVESQVGQGTTFSIYLPTAPIPEPPSPNEQE